MDETDLEAERIHTSRQEAFELRQAARDYLRRLDQMLTVGAAFVAAAAAAALKYREIMLGIPSAVLLLIAFAAQAYTDVVTADRARDAAEQAVRNMLGSTVMFYGRLAVPYRQGKYLLSSWAIGVAGGAVAVGASVGGAIIAHDIHLSRDPLNGHTVFIAYLVATSGFLCAALLAIVDFGRAARDSGRALQAVQRADTEPATAGAHVPAEEALDGN